MPAEEGKRVSENEQKRERRAACLQILYRPLQPPDPSIPIPGSPASPPPAAPSAPGARMVWGRAAGGARQIRELHCQAGMIYLTNISI